MSKNPFELGIAKLEVVRSSLPTGARRKAFIKKKQMSSKEII